MARDGGELLPFEILPDRAERIREVLSSGGADAILVHSRACEECGDQLAVMLALRSEGVGSGVSEPRARFVGAVAPRWDNVSTRR